MCLGECRRSLDCREPDWEFDVMLGSRHALGMMTNRDAFNYTLHGICFVYMVGSGGVQRIRRCH